MDPLSISASIIALMQLSSTVIGYLSSVNDGHKEQQKVRHEICGVLPMLSILEGQAQQAKNGDPWSSTLLSLGTVNGPIQQFRTALERLEVKLAHAHGAKKASKFFTWPFGKAEIQSILSTIERQKLLFSLARQNDHIALTKAIKGDVEEANRKINGISEGLAGSQCSKRHDSIRQWLAGPDPSSNYNFALSKRHRGTGSWLIESDDFQKWKQVLNAGSLMWLYGIPGCGKTILCSTILEHVLQNYTSTPKIAVVYFYFDFMDPDKQRPEVMLHSLLAQLSMHCVNVPPILETLYSSCLNGGRTPKTEAVLEAFHQITATLESTYIILDALDECNDRPALLAYMEELISWEDTNLRILVTSREEKDIKDSISPLTKPENRICIQSALIDDDVYAYVHDQIQTNKKLQRWRNRPEVQLEIEKTLVKKAHGMFRWVACQIESLERCPTLPILRKALAALPRTLNDTYARILCDIDEEYQQHALHLLQWLAFSKRSLNLEEAAEVIAIDVKDTPKFDPERRLADPYDVKEICSSLVTVTSANLLENPQIILAHFSVKEFLTSEAIFRGPAAKFRLQEIDCHLSLAKDCLAYLLHFDGADALSDNLFMEYPLLLYAVNYWTEHAKAAEHRDGTICEEFFLTRGEAFFNWLRLSTWDNLLQTTFLSDVNASPLYQASLAGLLETVKMLIDLGAVANAFADHWQIALIAASRRGHIEIVQLLLEKGARVHVENSVYDTALQAASSSGYTELVQSLLEKGAEMEFCPEDGTALGNASYEGHTEIVRLLLKHGADANILGPHGSTALCLASDFGYTEIVRLLLHHGADMDKVGDLKRTALLEASSKGHTEIVRLLLDHGADVDKMDYRGLSAWLEALSKGHIEIVRLLQDHSADVHKVENFCDTPLQEASSEAHIQIVRLLLKHGADIDIVASFSKTALRDNLYLAFLHQSQVPLDYVADVNKIRLLKDTALLQASSGGHTEITRLLLECGADANIVEYLGLSPLQLASRKGYSEIVRLLLEKGADVNPKNPYSGFALEQANFQGHMDIVKMLLEYGADASKLQK